MTVVLNVFHDKIDEITENFIGILMRKNRESHLPEIIDAFIKQYNAFMHITPVTITTAHPISDDVQNTLLAKLKSTVGLEQIELTTEIDENLIGGYILHWDDKMIDNSISRGLAILKDEFDNNDYVRKF
ncbi:MAG: ATP synthase F1 subunit delta [Bacteroidetes bacterium]|nr:ATP synthase F1 subunit delta [Bacteroidota bacterium]